MPRKSIVHSNDHLSKNYFLYRDTDGTGRWALQSWDEDLSFGRNYNGSVLNDEIWADKDTVPGRTNVAPSHPLFGDQYHQKFDYSWNKLIDAIYQESETEADVLPPPPDAGRHACSHQDATRRHIDALDARMAPEADLDRLKWGQYGTPQDLCHGDDVAQDRVPGQAAHASARNAPRGG